MIIAILQFEMLIPDPESLKDKRRVVRSVKDRLHRDFQCAVAEVAALENPNVARMGLAIVSNDGKHAAQVLDRITERLRAWPDAHLGDCRREIVHGHGASDEVFDGPDASEDEIAGELLRRSLDDPELAALERAAQRAGVADATDTLSADRPSRGGRP
ncbi:MAG: DUF503 domain-containing protein [Phycisphaerales bacterium]